MRCNNWLFRKQKLEMHKNNYNNGSQIDDEMFVLKNLYNANTEVEQINTLRELDQLVDR